MFDRPHFDIWRHTPFGPSPVVRQFVDRFVVNGQFDAQSFWEYVAKSLAEHQVEALKDSSARRASARSGQP